jgi:hypothetical protein
MRYFIPILLLSTFQVQALNLYYRTLSLTIPNNEITLVAMPNIEKDTGLLLEGEDWELMFSDNSYERNCPLFSKYFDYKIDCKDKLKFFDILHKGNEKLFKVYFPLIGEDWKDYYNFEKKEDKKNITYSLIPRKEKKLRRSVVIIINKKTLKSINIDGKFNKEQLNWINKTVD